MSRAVLFIILALPAESGVVRRAVVDADGHIQSDGTSTSLDAQRVTVGVGAEGELDRLDHRILSLVQRVTSGFGAEDGKSFSWTSAGVYALKDSYTTLGLEQPVMGASLSAREIKTLRRSDRLESLIDAGIIREQVDATKLDSLVDSTEPGDKQSVLRSNLKVDLNGMSAQERSDNVQKQVPEERIKCERPPHKRNRHKICQNADCGPPPNAFMLAIVKDHTMVESFSSEEDARFQAYWPGEVTRMEADSHMTPDKNHCVCSGCDEWMEWAIQELGRPEECKFPDHDWRLLFSTMNPTENKEETVKFKIGRIYEVKNDVMSNFEHGEHLTKQVFLNSRNHKKVAEAEEERTWKDAHTVDTVMEIEQGKNLAVYQYVMTCKMMNKVDMYVNTLEFRTPHLVNKDELEAPTCDPNEDGGFQECHKMASEENKNSERGRTEEVFPEDEDAAKDLSHNRDVRNGHCDVYDPECED